jgi:hypothetical protein
MMNMTRYRSIAALLVAAAVAACGDYEKKGFQDITGPVTGARVKFFNFGVNAPAVNFYANDTKVTAIASGSCFGVTDTATVRVCNSTGLESTNGVAFGSAGLGGLYSAVASGQYTLNGRIAAATDKGLQVAKVPATIADGKAYSVYVSGFYDATAKTVEGFVVEDLVPDAIDFTAAYVRFVNAISNSSAMTLYANSTTGGGETAIGGAVAYKSAGTFVKIIPGVYDLNTRTTGSSTNAISRTAVSFAAGRVYTIASRGDITIASSSTATNRSFLDNTANK